MSFTVAELRKADQAWEKELEPSRRSKNRIPYTETIKMAARAYDESLEQSRKSHLSPDS